MQAGLADATRDRKLTGLRRKGAQRMQGSQHRMTHVTCVEAVDVGEFEAQRSRLNTQWAAMRCI